VAFVRPHDFVLEAGGFPVQVQRVVIQGPLAQVDARLPDGRHVEICAARDEAVDFTGEVTLSARRVHVFAV
jgi:sulfate transport system ATP-binding protein